MIKTTIKDYGEANFNIGDQSGKVHLIPHVIAPICCNYVLYYNKLKNLFHVY